MSGRLCSIFLFCSIEKKGATKEHKLLLGNIRGRLCSIFLRKEFLKGRYGGGLISGPPLLVELALFLMSHGLGNEGIIGLVRNCVG